MLSYDNEEFSPENPRSSTSSTSLTFPPLLFVIDSFSRKTSFSYNKLPQEPLKLSVIKLDGSSFDVEVTKSATVAELKLAVEDVFSHLPKRGPGKISWPHVWGNFCLSYDGQKLLAENDYIKLYGIKDGDQLHFIRHRSAHYNLVKRGSKNQVVLKQQTSPTKSDTSEEKEHHIARDDQEYTEPSQCDNKEGNAIVCPEPRLSHFLKGWFSYSRLSSTESESNARSVKITSGLCSGFRRIIQLYREKSYYRREKPGD